MTSEDTQAATGWLADEIAASLRPYVSGLATLTRLDVETAVARLMDVPVDTVSYDPNTGVATVRCIERPRYITLTVTLEPSECGGDA
jgi:hypothetical protein